MAEQRQRRTIASLRLDLEEARRGRTWLLLPEGFRDQGSGLTYPLPSAAMDLQALASIYIPPRKRDSGCLYLKRALAAAREHMGRRESALHDIRRRLHQIHEAHNEYRGTLNQLQQDARAAVAAVGARAEQAITSLDQLFALGRKGIEGQMQAHLAGTAWQGEPISAHAFRECFRMVAQAVKGLGLPTSQSQAAGKAIVDELAASMEATKDALAHAPEPLTEPPTGETEH